MDKSWTQIGQKLTEIGQNRHRIGQMDKTRTTVDKSRNPLIRLAFRLFRPLFLSNLDKMDKFVDKKRGNP